MWGALITNASPHKMGSASKEFLEDRYSIFIDSSGKNFRIRYNGEQEFSVVKTRSYFHLARWLEQNEKLRSKPKGNFSPKILKVIERVKAIDIFESDEKNLLRNLGVVK